MKWQAPDSHRTFPEPRDDHRRWPALPFVLLGVMLLISLLLACEWIGLF